MKDRFNTSQQNNVDPNGIFPEFAISSHDETVNLNLTRLFVRFKTN